jgi:DedD protein
MEIDEGLRNRIVGATVVTILAMIFLPMLIDDPKEKVLVTEIVAITEKLKMDSALTATVLTDSDNVDELVLQPLTSSPKKVPLVTKTKILSPPVIAIPTENTPKIDRWFIQVASFNREENAFIFKGNLENQGFVTAVSPALSKGRSVYRVRVGPEANKQQAQAIKIKLDRLHHVNSIIVLSN